MLYYMGNGLCNSVVITVGMKREKTRQSRSDEKMAREVGQWPITYR